MTSAWKIPHVIRVLQMHQHFHDDAWTFIAGLRIKSCSTRSVGDCSSVLPKGVVCLQKCGCFFYILMRAIHSKCCSLLTSDIADWDFFSCGEAVTMALAVLLAVAVAAATEATAEDEEDNFLSEATDSLITEWVSLMIRKEEASIRITHLSIDHLVLTCLVGWTWIFVAVVYMDG